MPKAVYIRELASRLFAMALNARDMGQIEYADKLTKQALDVLMAAEVAQQQSKSDGGVFGGK